MLDGWDGPMTGTLRGHPLVRCDRHRGIWHPQPTPCPACALEKQVRDLERAAERRCQECKKGGLRP